MTITAAPEKRLRSALLFILLVAAPSFAQSIPDVISPPANQAPALTDAQKLAEILGLDATLNRLRSLQGQHACGSAFSVKELTIRQEFLEAVQTAVLDVDGVTGEILNERGQLSNLRASLQTRRDHTVAKLTSAALITGSGIGIAVNASKITTFSHTTNNTGDVIGIGSGVASTLLAYMAVRRQRGPSGSVGEVPNMRAPLFDQAVVLNTYYPPSVLRYLHSAPSGENGKRGTRLEQLRAEWVASGRLNATDSVKEQQKIMTLTTSANKDATISINDLTDRMAMLADVSGRVSLMKRDMSVLMRSHMGGTEDCKRRSAMRAMIPACLSHWRMKMPIGERESLSTRSSSAADGQNHHHL